MLKIMTIVGTRPEIIRLSRVINKLNKYADHVLVHTGQNYDYELNQVFFDDLELGKPHHYLNVDTTSLGSAVGDIIKKSEEVMKLEKPDAVLVLGDTNSCLAAYMAKRLHIPVYHMEAGNRCFDFNVPEETNRRLIDHISDFNLVYTEHARRHLISEGLQHRRIVLTGSPMYEVLQHSKKKTEESKILQELQLEDKKFFTVSFHREENVEQSESLRNILSALNKINQKYNYPIIVSTHPRTRKRIEALEDVQLNPNIQFLKPFGFHDYLKLQMSSLCCLSDSGTISEESAILGFPAVSIRRSMERPEALDAGSIILSGFNSDVILQSIDVMVDRYKNPETLNIPWEYKIADVSDRVLNLILGTHKLSNLWHGVNA